jgi:exonuclease SbcD
MKILHTADWHLGKRLDNFSRLEEQKQVCAEIIDVANREEVDVVLIAGDLFDNFNPSVEAIELFYKTVKALSNEGKRPVIAIAGNHDTPSLIDAPDPLARACGIILIGFPNAKVTLFESEYFQITQSEAGFLELRLPKYNYPLRLLHTAYANEQRLKIALGDAKAEQLNALLKVHWQYNIDTYCQSEGVNVLMTHLYLNKKGTALLEEPEGEKPIKIGNADLVFTDAIPNGLHYIALGHLHGYRNIGSQQQPIVYASSPLCYSFSEAGQKKFLPIVTLTPNLDPEINAIPVKSGRPLYRKTFQSVDEALDWLQANPNALVELTLIVERFLTAAERQAIYQAHDGIIYLIPLTKADTRDEAVLLDRVDLNQDLQTLFKAYFKSKYGEQEPNEELMLLFNEIINQA